MLYDQLAFSQADESTEELITAVARAPFDTEDGVSCNVELFGSGWGEAATATQNILLFVPGVCESAETWTVQNLARICKDQKWMLAVLELPGHGLSEGPRSLLQPSGRAGLDKLVDVVVHFARHAVNLVGRQIGSSQPTTHVNITLSGCSLGGVLAAYASPKIAKSIYESRMKREEQGSEASDRFKPYSGFQSMNFVGNILLSPAVGVAEQAVPPPMIVSALSCLAYVAPSAAIMTPQEDPSHYNCPSTTKRNFSGQWPLGTSKLLLDITANIVPEDVERCGNEGDNPFRCPSACSFESVVITGQKDHVVPTDKVQVFVEAINKRSDSDTPSAILVEIANGDHGLLVPGEGKSKVVEETSRHVQEALQRFARSNEAK